MPGVAGPGPTQGGISRALPSDEPCRTVRIRLSFKRISPAAEVPPGLCPVCRRRAIYQARRYPDLMEASRQARRSEEHTSELQSLMRHSYAVFCLKKKTISHIIRPLQ